MHGRSRMNRKKSRRDFRKKASHVHKKNMAAATFNMRGGIRL